MSNDIQIINKNSIIVSGKLIITIGKLLYKHLQELFQNNFKKIKLDITNVTLIDSYSLGTIVFFIHSTPFLFL